MQLVLYIYKEAENILQFEGESNLPQQIGDTVFFLAKDNDKTIIAHDVLFFNNKEYKIGVIRDVSTE